MKRIIFLASLLMAFAGFNLHAQGVEVTGQVTSAEDGSALPGVSVVVQGTTVGTVTDFDGNYSISVPDGEGSLMFSFVGMETQLVEIEGRTQIDVVLNSSTTQLDEVVVTALGIKRERREVTYQTQKVVDDELTTVQPTRAAAALAGKVAGLQINVQDNGVNPSTQILLRGLRSISGNNSALIVIDGSIASQGAFDDLNPNDIGDISVLKGATAAALYGSNASNGALIITTKSGRAGQKMTVGVTSSYTAEQVAYMPDFQTEYGTGWAGAYDAVENTNWGPRFDGTMRRIGPDFPSDYPLEDQIVPYAPVKDNLLNFFERGDTWNNTVYVTGGNENGDIYASVGDQRADGIIPDDMYKRNTFRVNASKRLGDVEVSANTSFFQDKTKVVGSDIGDQDRPLYWFVLNTSANIPLSSYSDWSNPLSYGYADNYYNAYYQNPYWAVGTNRNIDETSRFNGNVSLSWDIVDWVNFTTRVSANNTWGNGKNWRAAQEYDATLQPAAGAVSSFVEDNQFRTSSYSGDALLTAKRTFADMISLNLILGANVNMFDQSTVLVRANNLSIPGFYDVSNGTGSPEVTRNDIVERDFGFFTDVTLGYNDFLFLNFSGRNDWTSTLAEGNNSYFYPGFGLSFVFTDAIAALQDNQILSFGKLTASNSTVYNDLGAYRINEIYSQSSGFPFGSVNGFFLSGTAVDANIQKERINTTEVGLNLGFLNGRIWFDGAYFNTLTNDLITSTTPSIASASSSFLTNIGELQGTGLELTVGGSVIKYAGFQWDLNVNYTSYETVVNEIYEGLDEIALSTTGQYGFYAVKDMPFPQLKANVYSKDPEGRIIVDAASGSPLTETDLESLGKTTPDYILGLNSSVSFKGFKVSATFDYRTGHVYYEQGSDAMEFTGRSIASVSSNRQDFVIPNSVIEVGDGVYEENTNIMISGGRMSYWQNDYNEVKSNYVKDASAAKIRELAVNYSLPAKLLANAPVSKVSVGFIARNPFTWLPEENRFSDPEFNNTNSNVIGVGGYFQGPPTKSYGFTVNIEF
ncbi:MAG TPA: SusC/RagA family TonB-linked outer membrane protein [Bacteroidales bacterium]|nr:SusC/RagA family TonB-linked outer membrane protein [Bacteroidales bacterium]